MPGLLLVSAAALLASLPSTEPATAPAGALSRAIERAAAREPGVVGVAVVHVETGETSGSNAQVRFPMASTYKVLIAAAALERSEAGSLPLSREVTIAATDIRVGAGEEDHRAGEKATVEDLLTRMLVSSDNTATDLVLRELGGASVVSDTLRRHDATGLDVSRSELQLAADSSGVILPAGRGLTPPEFRKLARGVPADRKAAAEARFLKDARDTASPEAMARFLVRLQRGEILSPGATARLLGIMTRCATGSARLRALLPQGTVVADKTGTHGKATHDVGIVTLPGGAHVAIAVYVMASPRPIAERERVIAEVARAVWDHYAVPGRAPAMGQTRSSATSFFVSRRVTSRRISPARLFDSY